MNLNEIDALPEETYHNLDIDRLIVYAMVYLEKKDIQLTLENIVVGAYKLFPYKFSLFGFPEYPDCARVEKSLWRSRGKERQWLGGKTRQGYSLTRRSYMIAEEVSKDLSNEKEIQIIVKESTHLRRWEKIVKELEKSSAYEKFKNKRGDSITESEFCYVLQATLDSPKKILNENLVTLKMIAQDLNYQEVGDFLDILEIKFYEFLK